MRRIKKILKWGWRRPWVWRTFGARLRPAGVLVLTYHRIGGEPPLAGLMPGHFEAQMRWLREFCRPIRPSEFMTALDRPGRARPPVLVTFDDGYRDFHDLARPILERFGIEALVFLPTALIGGDRPLWTDEVSWLLAAASERRLSLPEMEIELPADPAARARAAVSLKAALKALPDPERRARLAALRERCRPRGPELPRQMMDWDEVRACRGVASFGGHSHTHPILSRVGDRVLAEEIDVCRDTIAAELGTAPEFFAYPNGRRADFDRRAHAALERAGFRAAFTTEPGWCTAHDERWALPRMPTGAGDLSDFAWLITHPGGLA